MGQTVQAVSFQDGCRSHHAATIGNGNPKRTTQHRQAFRVSIFNKVRSRAKNGRSPATPSWFERSHVARKDVLSAQSRNATWGRRIRADFVEICFVTSASGRRLSSKTSSKQRTTPSYTKSEFTLTRFNALHIFEPARSILTLPAVGHFACLITRRPTNPQRPQQIRH
jgi:hypothetical protein